MITDKEVIGFWNRYDILMVVWNAVSGFFLLSIALIPATLIFDWHWGWWIYHSVIPVNFLLKYGLRVKKLWFFNDTADGDFGDPLLLKKYGYENKPKWWRFIWWWFRNHSWNFISRFLPGCNSSITSVSEYRVFADSRGTGNTEWLEDEGFFYICYRCKNDGKVYCRYSEITDKLEKQFGAGGDRFKMHRKRRRG